MFSLTVWYGAAAIPTDIGRVTALTDCNLSRNQLAGQYEFLVLL